MNAIMNTRSARWRNSLNKSPGHHDLSKVNVREHSIQPPLKRGHLSKVLASEAKKDCWVMLWPAKVVLKTSQIRGKSCLLSHFCSQALELIILFWQNYQTIAGLA